MSNVFSQKDTSKPHLDRSNHDLQFQNNLTLKFGALYPVLCKPVTPNDSFEIKPSLLLRFMPMVYPVQSKIFANLHFFYVRNRTLWKNWKDFQFRTKDNLEKPYISQSDGRFFATGSLSDYLNIPNTEDAPVETFSPEYPVGNFTVDNPVDVQKVTLGYSQDSLYPIVLYTHNGNTADMFYLNGYRPVSGDTPDGQIISIPITLFNDFTSITDYSYSFYDLLQTSIAQGLDSFGNPENIICSQLIPTNIADFVFDDSNTELFSVFNRRSNLPSGTQPMKLWFVAGNSYDDLRVYDWIGDNNQRYSITNVDSATYSFVTDNVNPLNTVLNRYRSTNRIIMPLLVDVNNALNSEIFGLSPSGRERFQFYDRTFAWNLVNLPTRPRLPFLTGTASDGVSVLEPIDALPYRAYESIYNSFYRNQQNEPFIVNGQPEYNKWIPNDDDGADTYNYGLHYRCYEPDFLTTALPSPQQGIAPLVGVSSNGTFTFQDEQGQTYNLTPQIGADGETLTGISYYDSGMPAGTLQTMMHYISQGISINDFRNVNSFQRWLEKNIRKGYRYKDMIEGRFGTNLQYRELDMPEFIGGLSDVVSINSVVNTSEGLDMSSLGSIAGLGSLFSNGGHSINVHCDETGFIMAILSISPVPAYDMLLPKYFTYKTPLDYYSPEFAKIGMQPIPYSEVSPILRYKESLVNPSLSLSDTFGYQRAWYDLVASVDEVHGDFRRTSLRDYVLYRRFLNSPVLGSQFLDIHQGDLNNVFADTDDDDKIVGAIDFQITKKSIVPRYIVPALE